MIYRKLTVSIFLCSVLTVLINAAFASDALPFSIKIGGQEAKVGKESDMAAAIQEPVAADAELEVAVDVTPSVLIVNAFRSNAAGEVKDENAPAVIVGQNTKKVKLDATMDQKKLEPGFYMLSIVADGNTARVLIQVK